MGIVSQEVSKLIRIGDFSVSFTVGPNILAEENDFEIKKGLFTTQDFKFSGRIEENLDLVTSGFLTLDVLDTNSLGNLVVKVNNNVIFNQKATTGQIDIPIDKSFLKNFNVVEISSDGPGLKFWSTSYFKIEKAKFGINLFGKSDKTQSFLLQKPELENFKMGEVTFTIRNREGTGDLIIRINNRLVFKGIPSGTFTQSFDAFDVGLATDTNSIIFSTETGTNYEIQNAELLVTHESETRKTRTFNLVLSDSDIGKLQGVNRGAIKFFVVDSNNLGELKIKITNPTGVTHDIATLSSVAQLQTKIITFDDSDVRSGTNSVVFEAVGNGGYTLSNLEFIT